MKTESIKRWILTTIGAVLFLIASAPFIVVHANPASPFPMEVTQNNGTKITIIGHGDEFFSWTEDENGNVIAFNQADENWHYAQIENGKIVPGPTAVVSSAGMGTYSSVLRITRADLADIINNVDRDANTHVLSGGGASRAQSAAATINTNPTLLVILVEYSDISMVKDINYWHTNHFSTTPGVKSVNNYYAEVSGTVPFAFKPAPFTQTGSVNVPSGLTATVESIDLFDGVAKVKLRKPHPGYSTERLENNDVKTAYNAIKNYINFASISTQPNGTILNSDFTVTSVIAGWEASGGSQESQRVWAHAMSYRYGTGPIFSVDGDNTLWSFATHGEIYRDHPSIPGELLPMGIGVTAHELGHTMGLPDLYDTTSASEGVGPYSLMANGSWGGATGETGGYSPTHLDAWSKMFLGFVTPIEVASDAYWKGNVNMINTSDAGAYNIVKVTSAVDPNEYFLIENRGLTGYDQGLERYGIRPQNNNNGGIMIWHIDESVQDTYGRLNNANRLHRGVDAEEADGSSILEGKLTYLNQYQYYNHFFSNDAYVKPSDPYGSFGGHDGPLNIFGGSTAPNSNFYNGNNQSDPSNIKVTINSTRAASMEVAVGQITSVTSITGVPTIGTVGTPVTLSGTVNPSEATNRTIEWSLGTGSTAAGASVSGGEARATGVGTVVVTATVADGTAVGTDYTEDFTITFSPVFVPVTSITGVPTTGTVGTPVTLSGTVNPSEATSQTIKWSLGSGSTAAGASVSGGEARATGMGTVVVTATVADGTAIGTNYTANFTITFGGWQAEDGGLRYYENGNYVTGWKMIDGYMRYFHDTGLAAGGWMVIDGYLRYFGTGGACYEGWHVIDGYLRYFGVGGAVYEGWQMIDGTWRLFGVGGAVYTGWHEIDGYWRYFNEQGSTMPGWHEIDGYMRFFNEYGAVVTGWQMLEGKWYYFNIYGAPATGWATLDGYLRYFDANGAMAIGWATADGYMRYFSEFGIMYTSTQAWIDGRLYSFNEYGGFIEIPG